MSTLPEQLDTLTDSLRVMRDGRTAFMLTAEQGEALEAFLQGAANQVRALMLHTVPLSARAVEVPADVVDLAAARRRRRRLQLVSGGDAA